VQQTSTSAEDDDTDSTDISPASVNVSYTTDNINPSTLKLYMSITITGIDNLYSQKKTCRNKTDRDRQTEQYNYYVSVSSRPRVYYANTMRHNTLSSENNNNKQFNNDTSFDVKYAS